MKYLIAIGVLFGLLGYGGQGLYTYLQNPSPAELPCDQYLEKRPDAVWLRLGGCNLDVPNALYEYYEGDSSKPNRLFIPVHAAGAAPEAKTALVVETRDPKLMAAYKKVLELDKNPDLTEEQAEEYMEQHAAELFLTRDVAGVIRFGLDLDDSDRRQIAGLADELTEDFVILEEGKSPSPWLSLLAFVLGLAFLGFCVRKVVLALRGPTPALATPSGSGPPDGGAPADGPAKPLGPS